MRYVPREELSLKCELGEHARTSTDRLIVGLGESVLASANYLN